VSIVDMMVNTSVKTPTKAAEFIIAHNRDFEEEILQMQQSIIIRSQQLIAEYLQKINSKQIAIMNQARSLVEGHKEQMQEFKQTVTGTTIKVLNHHQSELKSSISTLKSGAKVIYSQEKNALQNAIANIRVNSGKYLDAKKNKIGHIQSIVKMADPINILNRGFALVSMNGKVITNGEKIKKGDSITVTLKNTEIETEVTSTQKKNGTETNV